MIIIKNGLPGLGLYKRNNFNTLFNYISYKDFNIIEGGKGGGFYSFNYSLLKILIPGKGNRSTYNSNGFCGINGILLFPFNIYFFCNNNLFTLYHNCLLLRPIVGGKNSYVNILFTIGEKPQLLLLKLFLIIDIYLLFYFIINFFNTL